MNKPNRECTLCKTKFYAGKKRIELTGAKYCSMKCYSEGKKGYKPNKNQLKALRLGHGWNKGLQGLTDSEHPAWKEEGYSYVSIHHWIYRKLGKPKVCQNCKITGEGKFMQWANISGKYRRDLNDWLRLCSKCHWHFDRGAPSFRRDILKQHANN